MKIAIKNARLAFPNLFRPQTFNGEGEPTFSASLLIPKNDPQIELIEKTINAVAKDKWGEKAGTVLKTLMAGGKTAFRDGDTKADYAGFDGHMFIAARNKARPPVFDADKTPLTEMDGKPYAGCYVVAHVDFWAQDNAFGKRINATLSGIQFLKDGEPFSGGAPSSADDFEDVSEAEAVI